MESYRVKIKNSATKEIEAVRPSDRRKIIDRIRTLAANPRPPGAKRLSGEQKYRIRQGDYRILYQIIDDIITVVVVRVGHRREVYRK